MKDTLVDDVILITGASVGIGRATAIRFAKEKCKIIITYNTNEEAAWETAEQCQIEGSSGSIVLHLNTMDDFSIRKAMADIIKDMGHIDTLVNNAGVIERKSIEEHTFEDIEHQLRTNLEGTIKLTQSVLPHLRSTIINVGSVTSLRGYPTLGVYAASKGGLASFSRTLAEEISPRKVYNILPRTTSTQMTNFYGDPPELVAETIVMLAYGSHSLPSGSDVSVGEPSLIWDQTLTYATR
ncbi:MAG: SDR family oxidoreductase [Euryarchaeota archaeon]|nr:SDR family oxidoreductase [Euryarchaeota archaeon]